MRHVLQAIAAIALLFAMDIVAGLANPAPQHEAWAPLVSHLRRAATTTTTSTSSTTTTSTSSTTTTTIVPADVSTDASWVGIYDLELADPGGANDGVDDGPNGYDMLCTDGTGDVLGDDSQFVQGVRSAHVDSNSGGFRCSSSGNNCNGHAGAFAFDGASDDFTVIAFVRADSLPSGVRVIAGTDSVSASTASPGGWSLYVNSSNEFCFGVDDDTTETDICDTSAFSALTWYSLAAVFDGGTDGMELYVDGTSVNTGTASGQPYLDATPDFSIANGAFGATSSLLARYDQVAVYAGRITQAWLTRLQVCMIDGSACSCSTSDPTQYVSRARHVSQGGPIAGPMPDCNQQTIQTE